MNASFLLLLGLAIGDLQAASVRDAPEKAADANDKMICKKFIETGSLVKSKRICKTKAEWQRERDEIRAGYDNSASCRIADGANCL